MQKKFKESFEKMKPIERVDYMMRRERIEREYSGSLFYTMAIFSVLIIGFMILLLVSIYGAVEEDRFQEIAFGFQQIPTYLIVVILVGFLFDLSMFIFKNKHLNELNEKYFNIEVNPKK